MALLFYRAGVQRILTQWMEGGVAEPIDEVAAFADGLLQNLLQQF